LNSGINIRIKLQGKDEYVYLKDKQIKIGKISTDATFNFDLENSKRIADEAKAAALKKK